jgi:hypothetical protein
VSVGFLFCLQSHWQDSPLFISNILFFPLKVLLLCYTFFTMFMPLFIYSNFMLLAVLSSCYFP